LAAAWDQLIAGLRLGKASGLTSAKNNLDNLLTLIFWGYCHSVRFTEKILKSGWAEFFTTSALGWVGRRTGGNLPTLAKFF
jgi:hypothetical protein